MRARGALAVALCALAGAGPAGAQERARFDTKVLGLVPAPGFPALGYVHPDGRIYAGTYVNMSGSTAPSKVFEYTGEGTRVRSWTVPGQNVEAENGVQVTTSDARGRLVLLDRSPSRALLLDRRTGDFARYSTFADLPLCPSGQTAPSCSPALEDRPAIPNFGAWGPDGSLYVTDYGQAVVWRVPPGGGPAVVWLADRLLDGGMFGTTGIALAADRRTLLVAQGSSAGLGTLTPSTGKLYSVAIGSNGSPGPLRQMYESRPGDLPDGFAIAASGRIYVPLVGLPQQIAVLSPEGREIERRRLDRPATIVARVLAHRRVGEQVEPVEQLREGAESVLTGQLELRSALAQRGVIEAVVDHVLPLAHLAAALEPEHRRVAGELGPEGLVETLERVGVDREGQVAELVPGGHGGSLGPGLRGGP